MGDAPEPIPTFVLNRGVYSALGEQVTPRGLDECARRGTSRCRQNRLGLTKWLFDPRNPLTARVFVNRLWQMHFGRGIVETAEDFGSQGSIPTHPELLDWLAVRFVESGWDIKSAPAAHRHVGNVQAALGASDESLARDAGNTLYARGPRLSNAGRNGARRSARGKRAARREGRRAERRAVSASGDLESAQQLLRLSGAGRICQPTTCTGARSTRS